MTEMQKQFEEWAVSKKWCIDKTGDTYNNTYVGCSWQAWQASRAAVVVKTDTMKDSSYEATGMVYLDAVEQALDEAGVGHE